MKKLKIPPFWTVLISNRQISERGKFDTTMLIFVIYPEWMEVGCNYFPLICGFKYILQRHDNRIRYKFYT